MKSLSDLFSFDHFEYRDLFNKRESLFHPLMHLKAFFDGVSFEIKSSVPSSVHLVNEEMIRIEEGVTFEGGSYIEGPCVIGKGSILRFGSYIRPYTLLGKSVVVGHASEVKHSIVMDFSHLAHFNYVGDSIVGEKVNLGSGAKCANLRFDKQNVSLFFLGERVKTPLRKLGAIIGDESEIGCNAVLGPGAVLVKKSRVFPCEYYSSKTPFKDKS